MYVTKVVKFVKNVNFPALFVIFAYQNACFFSFIFTFPLPYLYLLI